MINKGLYLVLAMFLLIFAGSISAQSNSSNEKKDQESNQAGLTITGVVTGINLAEKKIVIQEDSTHQKKSLLYTDRTMWRNPVTPGTVSDLKDGSRVTVTVNNNTIVRADISANKTPTQNNDSDTKDSPQ
jgi:hypothetical protein